MISLSTFLIVRFLEFPLRQVIDLTQTYNVKKYIYIVVVITVLPSIYFAYRIIQETIFKSNAVKFINKEINFERTQVISKTYTYNQSDSSSIELILTGETIDNKTIANLEKKLIDYSLKSTKLIFRQGIENVATVDISQIKSGIIEEIYHKNELIIKDKNKKIDFLENELLLYKNNIPISSISAEINAINPKVTKFSAIKTVIFDIEGNKNDTTIIVYLSAKSKLNNEENNVINNWLIKRLNFNNIKIMAE